VTYITGPSTRFEVVVVGDFGAAPKGGHMVNELTTGVLTAAAWLVVSAVLTLVAVFVATALA
jgi:hypothetical protein